jgi:magnesium-transporting ATPase (P-type)
MIFPRWERWGPLAGIAAVVCWIIAIFVGADTPDSNDSDQEIASFFASHSHRVDAILGFFLFLAGVLLFLGFLTTLRSRLVDAEGGPGRLATLGFGSGVATAVLFMVAVSIWTGPAFAASDTDKFHLEPNTYRLLNDLGYGIWVCAVVVAALLLWTTSAIALRSGLLPKWFIWVSVLAGILQLLAIFFIPVFIFWGWVLIVSLLLLLRSASRTRAPARAV